jgi:formyl-CoA transferase
MDQTTRSGALAGLRVIDLTQVMAGPFCTMLLADLGADVIKIEPPQGDSTRTMPGAVGTDSPSFNAVNRGKRSVVLNLKTTEGVDAAKALARDADILVENYRPGALDKLGLGYRDLSAINPRLIYASISGYGQTGPQRQKGGFDLVAQGVSGIMSVTGEPGGAPVKSGIPLTDLGAGLFATIGILAALEHRHKTGPRPAGGHVAARRRGGDCRYGRRHNTSPAVAFPSGSARRTA